MRIAVAGSTGMVGMRLVRAATAAGAQVRGMSRSEGVDLFSGVGVHEALDGVDVVVDVVQSPTFDEAEATHFFRRTSVILGRAARSAGVRRSVVLSVIGSDRVASARGAGFGLAGYYRAKFAHELATREEAPDPHVLRSAQLFNFVGQEVERGRDGADLSHVPDLLIQPVELNETVRALLALATGDDLRTEVHVAGPQRERLVELAQRFVRHHREPTEIVPVSVATEGRSDLLLPGRGADIVGHRYEDWLSQQPIACPTTADELT
jgi:dTDP-4-dehydrorhamnose reductase